MDTTALRQKLRFTLQKVRGDDEMRTVLLIASAISISMGACDPAQPEIQKLLLQLDAMLPHATPIIRQMKSARRGEEMLARQIIPFNFC